MIVVVVASAPLGAKQDRTERTVVRGAEMSAPVTPFIFDGDLRDLPRPPKWKPGDPIKEIPRRVYPKPGTFVPPDYEPGIDPLLQRQLDAQQLSSRSFTAPTRNFAGQGYTGVTPPDTVGEVGPNHYIQMVNTGGGTQVRIYDKSTPTPTELLTFVLDSLGSSFCAGGFGDPIVLHDQFSDRWLLSEFSTSGNNLCVYISQTSGPVTGGWFAYGFTAPSFPDYPKYGIWPTDANGGQGSYIVTANDGGPGIYALDRGAMLSGSPGTYQRVTIPGLPGFNFEAPTPADVDRLTPPPTGAPAIIMRHRDTENHSGPAAPGDLLEMWSFGVDWQTPANSVLSTETSIDVAEFDSALCGLTSFFCFPQPGTGTTLDPLREVIMNRLQYIKHDDRETLAGNFVVDVDGADHGGIRWFELEGGAGAWSLKQEGTYSIDADHRWMGASAMDQSGNIAVAYNVSSNTTFPSLRYTGRLSDDALGVMTQTEASIHAGTASSSSNRYGDYASMNLDPDDDCTFWFTGEDNTSSNWRTQITSFKFNACGCLLFPDPPNASAVDNGDNRIDISWDDSSLDTIIEYLVRRSRTSGGPYETIAVMPDSSPGVAGGAGYVYEDTSVSGSITYYYIVVASDGLACKSAPTNEVSATGTGPCTLPPLFAGLQSVTTPFSGVCTLDLSWGPGTDECGGPLTYDVYRSTTSGFTPGAGNLLVSGVSGTTVSDVNSLVSGVPYYYAVRAVDQANGMAEANPVEVSGTPKGQLVTGTWFDDAGDTEPAKMVSSAPWSIDPTEGNNGPNVYKTGSYGNNLCSDLATPELQLGTGSTLTFYSKYEIEPSWDKGEVQISTDGGNSWARVPMAYPGSSTNTSDECGLLTGTYFTSTGLTWTMYTADLSAWNSQVVMLRFVLSTDGSVNRTGWWIDDIAITQVDVPGTCATGSSCADNPFVDVDPDGPLAACLGTSLTASLAGGNGPFSYQWTQDGIPVPGASGPFFTPTDVGTHIYNCDVQAQGCPDAVFDGFGTELTTVVEPSFGGAVSVSDPQTSDCSLLVDWNPASTLCEGPLTYYVYRDTASPVDPTPGNLVAAGLTGTSFADSGGLAEQTPYHYLVRALDLSTLQFDSNVIEATSSPTGPGTGIFTLFNEDFENPASLGDWTITTQPPNKTCGVWARASTPTQLPSGGSGFYAVADASACGPPTISTILESPVTDLSLAGIQSVTLEYDIYYNFLAGGDEATVEVWNGSAWQVVWADGNADLNGHQSLDVTAHAAGTTDFRVRFNYQDADQWFSVDNVVLIVDIVNSCATQVGPPPVPDGTGAGNALFGSRVTPNGDVIDVSWDVTSCTASDYNLLYGDLANVSSYALSGGECAIGAAGTYMWNSVPSGDLYFLIVGTDGSDTESSWGVNSFVGERNGMIPSGMCSTVTKDISTSCP